MGKLLQDHNCRALSHHKTASVFVKGKGTSFRVVHSRKGGQRGKSGDSHRRDTAFRPPCHHHVRLPVLNRPVSLPYGICTGGAGRHGINAFSLQPELNGNVSRRHVANHQGNHQRVNPVRTFFKKLCMLPLHCLQTSDTGADGAAHKIRVLLFHGNAGIRKGLRRCRNRIPGKILHPLCRLEIHIVFGVKALHLRGNFTLIFRYIKLRNGGKSMLSVFYGLPKFLHVKPNRRNRPHTRYNHSPAHIMTMPFPQPAIFA